MNRKIKLAYLMILSNKAPFIPITTEEYFTTFNWISKFDINPNCPWFAGKWSTNMTPASHKK